MAYIYDIADVWAASGTTFTGIKLNVTDTASASGSLLMDLQVGGTSQFSVRKNGISVLSSLLLGGGTYGGDANWWSGNNLNIASASVLSFGPADTVLRRDAANTLAQRNGVNAQAFNLYNTHTDASNFERGFMRFVSNVLQIGSEKLGTGTARALEFQTDGTTRLTIGANGAITATGAITGSGSIQMGASGVFSASGRSGLVSPSNGIWQMSVNAGGDFNRLQLGGATSSFPALKRSTTSLQARLADDSAFTNIQGKLTTDTAYTAGAPTATGYIVLFDGNGTAYKVPAEAL